jgi:hypothetical protein
MSSETKLKITVCGPFAVTDSDGNDCMPAGIKEKALLALLAFAPDHRRPRIWLQNKLWSGRFPEQAGNSFRRALSNVRKALGDSVGMLKSDRTSVWIEGDLELDFRTESGDGCELLEDVRVNDPEFRLWLSTLPEQTGQGGNGGANVVRMPINPAAKAVLSIFTTELPISPEEQFVTTYFVDRLAEQFSALGDIEVRTGTAMEGKHAANGPDISVEVQSVVSGGNWFLSVRVCSAAGNRHIWSGRLRLPLDMKAIWDGTGVTAFLGRIYAATVQSLTNPAPLNDYFRIQHAALQLFSGKAQGVFEADDTLGQVQNRDLSGAALAWRGFAKLTRALEFDAFDENTVEEAVELANDAIGRGATNPVVVALGAQVHMKLNGDFGYGMHLARQAIGNDDQNAYALFSYSQASILNGDFEKGHLVAKRARDAAQYLPNSFSWDLQCCLTAMGVGRYGEALGHAFTAHVKMPSFRPALRYLVALNLITGKREDAEKYAARLKVLEPDFGFSELLRPGYPVQTLRLLDLAGEMELAVP